MSVFTTDDVRSLLLAACDAAGSQVAWARQWGISTGYVNDVLKGRKLPGPKILQALGLEAGYYRREGGR